MPSDVLPLVSLSNFRRSLLALVAATVAAGALSAQEVPTPASPESFEGSIDVVSDLGYRQLQEWRFAAQPVPVPAGGLTLRRDTATWTLASGDLRLMEPTASGAVTGLVFEGIGRFEMTVPDPLERAQLGRFLGEPHGEIERLDLRFERLVLRSPDVASLLATAGFEAPAPAAGSVTRSSLAAERHDHWLTLRSFDADARVVAALATPGDDYLRVGFETPEGWLTFEDDPWRVEEVELTRWLRGVTESWLAIDRHRDASGRRLPERPRRVVLQHLDVVGDLTEPSRRYSGPTGQMQPRAADFTVTARFEAQLSGPRALLLELHPAAELASVADATGRELTVLRDRLGTRTSSIPKDFYDSSLVVLLPEPLEAGETLDLTFRYELPMLNYLPGAIWYPTERGAAFYDRVTATFRLTARKNHVIRAMGRRVSSEEVEGKAVRELWRLEEPTRMLTFTLNDHGSEKVMEVDGVPEIVVFGPRQGLTGGARTHNIAADVANTMAFFGDLFQMPLETDQMVVTSIDSGHGQAFEGFLHLSEGTFRNYTTGATELFRAHEVAHQWWGHEVAWETYRDQWLSEAFAEYSAMLFLQASFEKGDEELAEILRTYTDSLCGSLRAATGRYRRFTELNDQHRERIGPIAVGYRAGTADAPAGYFFQSYVKGPMVLHTLRMMLANMTKSDEVFLGVLRDFLATHRGKEASTADFVAALERRAPADWSWFFRQWVEGTAIPTYAWDWKADRMPRDRRDQGDWLLRLTVRQEGVPEGFQMPVPVAIDLGGDGGGQVVMLVDQPEETFEIPLPAKPREVELNPDHAVLACMKRL